MECVLLTGWGSVTVDGIDARDGRRVTAIRRRLVVDHELPWRDDYVAYVSARLAEP